MPLHVTPGRETVLLVRWAVEAATRTLRWRNVCLVQATAAKVMLRRRGLVSSLYLGASIPRRTELKAHAWLRSGEIMVTGQGPGGHAQVAVYRAPSPGELKENLDLYRGFSLQGPLSFTTRRTREICS